MGKVDFVKNRINNAESILFGCLWYIKLVWIDVVNLKIRKTNCSLELVLCAIGALVSVYTVLFVGKKENFNSFRTLVCSIVFWFFK